MRPTAAKAIQVRRSVLRPEKTGGVDVDVVMETLQRVWSTVLLKVTALTR